MQHDQTSQRSNLLVFPSTPPFSRRRKRGALSDAEKKHHIATNLPALLPAVRADIVRTWRRGVKMAFIAKMHQLTISQTEAVIWCADHSEWEMRRVA